MWTEMKRLEVSRKKSLEMVCACVCVCGVGVRVGEQIFLISLFLLFL